MSMMGGGRFANSGKEALAEFERESPGIGNSAKGDLGAYRWIRLAGEQGEHTVEGAAYDSEMRLGSIAGAVFRNDNAARASSS
jgi:hypothetical protein